LIGANIMAKVTGSLRSRQQQLSPNRTRAAKNSFIPSTIPTGASVLSYSTSLILPTTEATYDDKQEKPLGGSAKRLFDLMISFSGILLYGPALLILVCLIYLTMGRPIFFSHERIGLRGRTFKCYKFRTMVNDARQKLEIYLRDNPAAMAEWEACHKLKNDPRITALGSLLRKSSLDELPQLINILRGDMSLVGPRPVTLDELSRYKKSARYYAKVRPGLTGLWQVRGRSSTTYQSRVALDRAYVVNWSIWLDIRILIETIPAVFRFHETV
jgi:exopolysaccharide production protein ExoY